MLTYSLSHKWQKVRPTSETSNGYRTIAATATEPVTAATATATSKSVQQLASDYENPHNVRSTVEVIFFGTGADNATFSARCLGWNMTEGTTATRLWIPTTLLEVTVTLSTSVGVAGGVLVAADRFADTIALVGTSGNDDVTFSITSPADNTIAHLSMAIEGSQKLEWIFTTGGSATDCNALWRLL